MKNLFLKLYELPGINSTNACAFWDQRQTFVLELLFLSQFICKWWRIIQSFALRGWENSRDFWTFYTLHRRNQKLDFYYICKLDLNCIQRSYQTFYLCGRVDILAEASCTIKWNFMYTNLTSWLRKLL